MKARIFVVSAVAMLALAGCSSGTGTTASGSPSASASQAQLVGTWTGEAKYADPKGSTGGGPETLVIEKQEGPLLWGYTEYVDTDGTTAKKAVTGTLTGDGTGVVLTEPAAMWQGTVDGTSATFVVSWTTSDAEHGAFEMTMTKQ